MSADTTWARRAGAALAASAIVVCVAAVSAQAAAPGRTPGVVSGMNGESLSKMPRADWGRQLATMASYGVQVVRSDADWGTIEPNPPSGGHPTYDFAATDAWVEALAIHHLRWQPILDYNNSWAVAVNDTSAFAGYGQAVARRYGPGGSFWADHPRLSYLPVQIFEVWNEENAQPWFINPLSYGPLYVAVHDAIHDVDATASVDVGGLADDSEGFDVNLDYPSQYVIRLLTLDPLLRGHVDGFALHPYGLAASDVVLWVSAFRHTLDALGEGSAPIDLTEFGWLSGNATEEQWRAEQMADLGAAFADSSDDLREVAPYDWINSPAVGDPGDFGFVGEGGRSTTLRPAALAWFRAFGTLPVRHKHKRHRAKKRKRRATRVL